MTALASSISDIDTDVLLSLLVKSLENSVYDEFKYFFNQMVDDDLDGVEFSNLRDEVFSTVCERLTISYK